MEVSNTTISEIDNLNLADINIPIVPADILFPDELNLYLKGQLQFMIHKNGMLQRTITEQDVELKAKSSKITELSTKILEYEGPPNSKLTDISLSGNPSHLLSSKIVELSKKLKNKTVETESLKTKLSKLQQKLLNLENCPPKDEQENNISNETEVETKPDLSEEVKLLQDKLFQTNNKLFEMKDSNVQLKNDLKAAHKLLQQEIGESFTTVQSFSNYNSNWRGRAQQIINLQQKNAELQEKIKDLSEKETRTPVPKVDPRKQQIEQLQKDINEYKNELEDTKKKLNGSRARVKVLENECCIMRGKISMMEAKSANDDRLIQLLQKQVSSLEETNLSKTKEKQAGITKVEEENKKLQQELGKERIVIDDLRKIVDEKDNKIRDLLSEVENAKNKRCNSASSRPSSSSPKNLNRLKILEVEVNRLLELSTVLNARLDEERNNHCITQINYKRERQRAAKLELKLSRLELEYSMNTKPNLYSTKTSSKLSAVNEDTNTQLELANLKNNLELAEENISILKTKLNIIQKEKDLDYQKFSSILSETSSMLLKYNNNSQQNE